METHGSEASCAVVAPIILVNEGSDTLEYPQDNAVAAYGWNNAPFNFAGRAGGWVNSCTYTNN